MALWHLCIALAVQGAIISASDVPEAAENNENVTPIKIEPEGDDLHHLLHASRNDGHAGQIDIMGLLFGPQNSLYTSSTAAKMAQVTNSDKSPEEQLEGIKEMANDITEAIKFEMANLLSYALANCNKDSENNKLRRRRSTEAPIDTTELVMRLLKHIKSTNEYQNIAIEKMMTAQEIANKFGIEFNPDPEILTDMAVASNKQAGDLAVILQDACDTKNVTEEVAFVPMEGPQVHDDHFYVYAIEPTPETPHKGHQQPPHHHKSNGHRHHHHHQQPVESQIPAPPVSFNGPPPFMPSPSQDYFPQCFPYEPVTTTTTTTIILPAEPEPEPELVGEEYEETVTSKVYVDHETPGESVVNHVMTYTVAEKAHFRAPAIEKLPQQMQYYFYL